MNEIKRHKEAHAENLKLLAKHHKDTCKGDCGGSLMMLGLIYKDILGRNLTDEELKLFI